LQAVSSGDNFGLAKDPVSGTMLATKLFGLFLLAILAAQVSVLSRARESNFSDLKHRLLEE
jgi:hypothetical protein